MIDQPSQLSSYENLAGEYGNIELHPEVPPELLLPTYYSLSSILSRVSVINRPAIPELDQIAVFPIDDAYRIVNINNIPQNFVLHRQTDFLYMKY